MTIKTEVLCRNYLEHPGCLGTPDPKYTMHFDDIGEEPIYWCAHCGPQAHAINDAIMAAGVDPKFVEKLRSAIEKAEGEVAKTKS